MGEVEDNLFDLGMHSILALRLIVELEKKFGRKISLAALLHITTIAPLTGNTWEKNKRWCISGGTGFGHISVPFLGRPFPFGTGFAELAIMTEAVVIPVFTSLKSSGHITVEFLEPLKTSSSDMSHQERIASLITQYAALLEQRWRTDPGNINPGPLRRFLKSLIVNTP